MHAHRFALRALSFVVPCVFAVTSSAQCFNGWTPLGGGNVFLHARASQLHDPDGAGPLPERLVVAGLFDTCAGLPAGGIAALDLATQTWSTLGTGVTSIFGPVGGGVVGIYALARLPNGDLVAGGIFDAIDGVPANYVARWDGSSWSPLGNGTDGPVFAMTVLPNGDLVVVGGFGTAGSTTAAGTARWNGSVWSPLGSGTAPTGFPTAVAGLANGDVLVGGAFTAIGGVPANGIARWNGSTWSPLGSGLGSEVYTILPLPNGDIVAGGLFTLAGGEVGIARWNGTTWSSLGTGVGGTVPNPPNPPIFSAWVASIIGLPNGDLLVGGSFFSAGSASAQCVARWNGASWSAVGSTLLGGLDYVFDLSMLPTGEVAAVGSSGAFAVTTTCPAMVASSGLGCASSGGSNTLVADVPPWVDATFRATGSGLPTNAIVITLTSVTPILQGAAPLTSVFPQAGPGCDVLVAPDILGVLVTTTGTAQSSFFLPNTPPLVGVTFFHQMIPIEVGAGGAWTSVTATNALQLTAGMF